MPYFVNPSVSNETQIFRNGKRILAANTTVVLDCIDPGFGNHARDVLEREQLFIKTHYGFDEVCLTKI